MSSHRAPRFPHLSRNPHGPRLHEYLSALPALGYALCNGCGELSGWLRRFPATGGCTTSPSPEAAAWWGEFLYQELPPLAEGCPAKGQLLMVSPLSRVTLWLRRDQPAPIRLQAISDLPGPIQWYVGSTYLGAQGGASAKGLLYWPPSVDTMLVFSCLQGGLRYSRSCRIRWL